MADQLLGVSEVMDDFAKEIQRERENHHKQEESNFRSHTGVWYSILNKLKFIVLNKEMLI